MNYGHLLKKTIHRCLPEELVAGDCWIALSLVQLSGLILCGRVGKHSDDLAIELVTSTQGKTDCTEWNSDGWESYERALGVMVDHYVSKALTQRSELSQRYSTPANWADRIDDKTSLARYGTRQKLPYVWSSPTSIGFGSIRAWELPLHSEQS
jgi:hypothetical protein